LIMSNQLSMVWNMHLFFSFRIGIKNLTDFQVQIMTLFGYYFTIVVRSELEGFWTASKILGWPSKIVVRVVKGKEHVDDSTSNASCSEFAFS
jgi:hypothetical protein